MITQTFKALCEREFSANFRSPVAFVYAVIFSLGAMGSAFYIGHFFEGNQANLDALFQFLPWIGMVLVPAFGMRLWAEDRRVGTFELLLTLPTTLFEAVLAKFLAAWIFLAMILVGTLPLFITVNYLGHPDNKVIVSSYLGTWLLYGVFLSVAAAASALSKNQVVAFVIGVCLNFIFMLLGWGLFGQLLSHFLPQPVVDAITALGVLPSYEALTKGIVDSRDLLYFASLSFMALTINYAILEAKKAQ